MTKYLILFRTKFYSALSKKKTEQNTSYVYDPFEEARHEFYLFALLRWNTWTVIRFLPFFSIVSEGW